VILVDSTVILDVLTQDQNWRAWSERALAEAACGRHRCPTAIIGAHAAVAGFKLLTRDARRYEADFPGVALITPA
jgi:predicted nucleic acid-binding protein